MQMTENIINIAPKYSLIIFLLPSSPIKTLIVEKNPKFKIIEKKPVILKINPNTPYNSGPISLARNVFIENIARIEMT